MYLGHAAERGRPSVRPGASMSRSWRSPRRAARGHHFVDGLGSMIGLANRHREVCLRGVRTHCQHRHGRARPLIGRRYDEETGFNFHRASLLPRRDVRVAQAVMGSCAVGPVGCGAGAVISGSQIILGSAAILGGTAVLNEATNPQRHTNGASGGYHSTARLSAAKRRSSWQQGQGHRRAAEQRHSWSFR